MTCEGFRFWKKTSISDRIGEKKWKSSILNRFDPVNITGEKGDASKGLTKLELNQTNVPAELLDVATSGATGVARIVGELKIIGEAVDEIIRHLRVDEIAGGDTALGDRTGEENVLLANVDLEFVLDRIGISASEDGVGFSDRLVVGHDGRGRKR